MEQGRNIFRPSSFYFSKFKKNRGAGRFVIFGQRLFVKSAVEDRDKQWSITAAIWNQMKK